MYNAEFSRLEVIQNVYSKAEEQTSLKYTSANLHVHLLIKD